uniref:SHSP domain-containing protein n=1 Tax=Steinernema glaseri TaxID=37863 RepID=A0A1I7YDA6_9BILA
MSSTEWEFPSLEDPNCFAVVRDTSNIFSARIYLSAFEPVFDPKDVDVTVYENDVQINAYKENPEDPNHSKRELHRQYRMPDDVDLSSIRLERVGKTVKVDARKTSEKSVGPEGVNIRIQNYPK